MRAAGFDTGNRSTLDTPAAVHAQSVRAGELRDCAAEPQQQQALGKLRMDTQIMILHSKCDQIVRVLHPSTRSINLGLESRASFAIHG